MLVAGQIDHASRLRRATTAVLDRLGRGVVPDVLIHAQGGDVGEACLVGGRRLQQRLDRPPYRAPGRAPLPGDPGDRGLLAAQLPDGPPARPRGQQRLWPSKARLLLGERLAGALDLGASPGSLAPDQLHQTPEAGHVDQVDVAANVAATMTPQARQPIGSGADWITTCIRPGCSTTSMTWNPSSPTRRSQRSQYEEPADRSGRERARWYAVGFDPSGPQFTRASPSHPPQVQRASFTNDSQSFTAEH